MEISIMHKEMRWLCHIRSKSQQNHPIKGRTSIKEENFQVRSNDPPKWCSSGNPRSISNNIQCQMDKSQYRILSKRRDGRISKLYIELMWVRTNLALDLEWSYFPASNGSNQDMSLRSFKRSNDPSCPHIFRAKYHTIHLSLIG